MTQPSAEVPATPSAEAPAAGSPVTETLEVRLLDGPNLYFTRPAVKVTLAFPGVLGADAAQARAVCASAGLHRVQVGAPGSGQRQRLLVRLVQHVARALATESGTKRLGIRTRPGSPEGVVVCAFVWRHRGRARALAAAIAPTVAGLVSGRALEDLVARHAPAIEAMDDDEPPRVLVPAIPVVSVTGTNGKTTTTRLLAHLCMTAGLRTGWSSTDGVLVQGELIEAGDFSGPAGARTVLTAPGVEVGILETARGGLLLRGMGVAHNDISVVTNVSADHLGQYGIDTLDQLAEVKRIVTRVTRPDGWVVLGGDDPRVWAMHAGGPARPWVFTATADAPAVREALTAGGRAATVLDGSLTVLTPGGAPDRLLPVREVPVTLSGLSSVGVLNALAATAAALGLGLPREAVIEGLRTFRPDAQLNPGRMNTFTVAAVGGVDAVSRGAGPAPTGARSLAGGARPALDAPTAPGEVTVIVDLAHNEAGLEALLDVCHGLVLPGSRIHLVFGAAGDRTDDLLRSLAGLAGRRADHVVIAHKPSYLRGRPASDLERVLREGLMAAGVADVAVYQSELSALQATAAAADGGDVVAVMCHAERADLYRWLGDAGAVPDTSETLRRKVIAAAGEHEAEGAIAALWELDDERARIEAGRALYLAHPDDARVAYEYGGTYDSAGDEARAVLLYREALAAGLREPYRHHAEVQLASSLRNLGDHDAAREVITQAAARHPESLGIAAFRALIEHSAGDPAGALRGLLSTLAATSTDADVDRYRRAIAGYAHDLATDQR
ncbi:MAG: tetratricopeptide repeat protein [Dermatophilaceae bacterium]